MQKLEVFGANKLRGQIKVSGSKNASLPILAATLLSKKKVRLKNIPKVKDIETMINLLQSLGSRIKFNTNNFPLKSSLASPHFYFSSFLSNTFTMWYTGPVVYLSNLSSQNQT